MNDTNNGLNINGFTAKEITDLPALVSILRDPANPLSKFLMEKFSEEGRQIIAGSDPPVDAEKLKSVIAAELTQVCRGGWIYDPVRFAKISLRTMTQAVIKKRHAHGLDLAWLNRLLLQDAFLSQITPEADTLVAEWQNEGIHFAIYCEERLLVRGVGISYKIVYKTPVKWDSKHAKTLEKAKGRIKYLASEIHSGTPPPSKPDTKERDAKAKAYDEITAEVAKTGRHGEGVFEFIKDAVKAQMELGLTRPLLAFVIAAIAVMPKPVKRMLLWTAFLKFKAFNDLREGVTRLAMNSKNADLERFAKEAPACEKLAAKILSEHTINGDLQAEEPLIDKVSNEVVTIGGEPGAPPDVHADEVSALGLSIWLRRLKVGWKRRRDYLDNVRSFYKYLRDEHQAVAQTPTTVAHVVPRPKREGKKKPVSILWFVDVWRILINLQDLESVFFVALGVFAGLHQEEIYRLVWEWDIIPGTDGEAAQIFIASGNGKETGDAREGKYVDVRFPLNKILLLGKGRTGKIITNKSSRNKLTRLVERLLILWDESIMRHTFATYLYGSGYTIEEVAKQLRDISDTVRRYYLFHIPKEEADQLWTLPFEMSIFAGLPDQLREWDFDAPLKEFNPAGLEVSKVLRASMLEAYGFKAKNEVQGDGTNQAMEAAPGARVPTGEANPTGAGTAAKQKRSYRWYRWPSDLELQVLLWEMKQADIAIMVGCRQTTVSARAVSKQFKTPNDKYWRLKKQGKDVEWMVPDLVKQARLALQKLQAIAGSSVNITPILGKGTASATSDLNLLGKVAGELISAEKPLIDGLLPNLNHEAA